MVERRISRKCSCFFSAAFKKITARLKKSAHARLYKVQPRASASSGATQVPLVSEGGTFKVPVLINGVIELHFMLDSGASDVSIPVDVVSTLIRAGTLKDSDFFGTQTYVLADGSKVPSQTFRIRTLKVGDRVIENVVGSVADVNGSLLLGQSFLSKLNSWSIDNSRQVLILE
jgi:clan AA aspartic protease (TIGR02281 family)